MNKFKDYQDYLSCISIIKSRKIFFNDKKNKEI